MRRFPTIAVCALLLIAAGGVLYAQSSTLTVKPSEMRDGETKVVTDDGRTITVRREGDTTHVQIEGADETERLTITREGDRIRIGRVAGDGSRSLVIGPDRQRIVIDGLPFEDLEKRRFRTPERATQTFFVCPKDRTMLRVPQDKADQTYRCPVDGTQMEKRRGHGFTLFFDDSSIEL